MNEYRVQLDVFHGPMDLLLYLVRKNEVEVTDIPIALVTEQYLQYVNLLKEIDPESAAEFLVLAATLMEIKSRCLLPVQTEEDATGAGVAEIADPRGELIRQLLEYKEFKDRALMLDHRLEETARRFARVPADLEGGGQIREVDLSEIGVWELLCAFERIMSQVQITGVHQVLQDDTPLELHAADILDRLAREGPLPFEAIFEGRTNKVEVIGLFLAVLQLMKDRKIRAARAPETCGIVLELVPEDATKPEEAPVTLASPSAEAEPVPTEDKTPRKRKRAFWKREEEGENPELEPMVQPEPALAEADKVLANFSLHPPTAPLTPDKPVETKTESQ